MSILGTARSPRALARDPLARLAEVAAAAAVALHHEVDVGIVHALARGARADLQIDRVAVGAVDQAMGDAAAGLEAGGIPGPQHGLAVILLQDELAVEHVDELVLLLVPVPQSGRRAPLDAGDVDAELGEAGGVADLLLFASGDHRCEFL